MTTLRWILVDADDRPRGRTSYPTKAIAERFAGAGETPKQIEMAPTGPFSDAPVRRPYAERKAARVERLRARAARLAGEGQARVETAKRRADVIPFGQPILVGHHSERRDRRFREKIRDGFTKGYAALNEAAELERRADRAESNDAISSDDPEAIDKLRAKLEKVARMVAFARRVNLAIRKAWRKGANDESRLLLAKAALLEIPEVNDAAADKLLERDCFGRRGVPTYRVTNGTAEMRRILSRIEHLRRSREAAPREPEQHGDVRIEEADNRVRIIYPDKPSVELRARLKRSGFRWAPTMGAWVRMASPYAWDLARGLVR